MLFALKERLGADTEVPGFENGIISTGKDDVGIVAVEGDNPCFNGRSKERMGLPL